MRLIEHITIALTLCAIPAVAVGQTVTCDDCTHQVSVYMGEGGFIATAAEGADMVTWVASCGGAVRRGELMPGDDGIVAALLAGELACHSEGGSFELGPIMDGGWYWLTMETNSAVGGLVAKNILGNDNTVMPADAGPGVTLAEGAGAVLLTETATGRVGILPTILPVKEPEMTAPCGYAGAGTPDSPYTRRASNCMLGDGGTTILATRYDGFSGETEGVVDGGTFARPAGDWFYQLNIDLWGNGTGHFFSDGSTPGDSGINFVRGHGFPGMDLAFRTVARLTDVTWTVLVDRDIAVPLDGAAVRGIWRDNASDSLTLSVSRDAYCAEDETSTDMVTVSAIVGDTGAATVTPNISRTADTNVAATFRFSLVCPSASANMGQELVPEHLFPIE